MTIKSDSPNVPAVGPYLLPVGTLMGRLPDPVGRSRGEGPSYLLRRGGQFSVLTEIEQLIFLSASACLSNQELMQRLAGQHPECKGDALQMALGALRTSRALLELCGDPKRDQQAVEPLIVVPRARSLGCLKGSAGVFALLTPDKAGLLTFDVHLQLLWARADGHTTMGRAVADASNDNGKTQSYLWERCSTLLRLLVTTQSAFIDIAQGEL